MNTDPEEKKEPEQDNAKEQLSRYTNRHSVLDDLMNMDEIPSVPAKSPARSGKKEENNGQTDESNATAVYDYESIIKNLSNSGLNMQEIAEVGETEAMLPIKDTEGFHIVIMAPGERVKPFLWPDGAESVSLGRDKVSVDIWVNDNRVSRVHLQIKRIDDKNIEVIDLGSTNHSYMSQDALKPYVPTPWKFGEILVVGRTRLVLRRGIPLIQ